MVRVVRLERTVSWSQTYREHFFRLFLAVFSGFLSILIPFLTSCDPHLPCVPHLSVAFYVVKSKASPEQFQQGFAVFSASLFSTRGTTRNHPRPPHEVGCHNQRKQPAQREIFREERSWRKGGCGVKRTPPYHTITLKLLRRANTVKNRSSKN